jgi:hypothetical protein
MHAKTECGRAIPHSVSLSLSLSGQEDAHTLVTGQREINERERERDMGRGKERDMERGREREKKEGRRERDVEYSY